MSDTSTESITTLANKMLDQARLLFNEKKYKECEEICLQILAKQPGHFDTLIQMSLLALEVNNYDVAMGYGNEAIKIDSANADGARVLGLVFLKRGNIEVAKTCFMQAVSLGPNVASSHYNLGIIFEKLTELTQAIQYYRKAIELDPTFYQAYNSLGAILKEKEQFKDALECFEQAFALKPNEYTSAKNMANIYSILGYTDKATAFNRRALMAKPGDAKAYLGICSNKKYNSPDDKDIQNMESAIIEPGINDEDKVFLNFALGKAYDDCKEYEMAFEHYDKGNKLNHSPAPEGTTQLIDTISNIEENFFFTKSFFKERKGYGIKSKLPFFIVGMPRSGSSLIEQMLSSHSEVTGAGELQELLYTLQKMHDMAPQGASYPGYLKDFSKADITSLANIYINDLQSIDNKALHIINKMPANFEHIGAIRLLFPNAKVVHSMRHPLDTCLSIYFQYFFGKHFYDTDLLSIASTYKKYAAIMQQWHKVLPGYIYDACYERLINSPEHELGGLLKFCDLDWQDSCLQFDKNKRAVTTASAWQVRQPIYKTSKFRWKNYEKYIQPLKEELADEIKQYEDMLG